MNRIRAFYDADRDQKMAVPTRFRTEKNKHELFCGNCGEVVFVDDMIFDEVKGMLEKTMENPFVCEDCIEEYEDLAHSRGN